MTKKPLPKGTVVTCENGHFIAKTKATLRMGKLTDPRDFAWAKDMPKQAFGEHPGPCPRCGAPWQRGTTEWELHTESGWW